MNKQWKLPYKFCVLNWLCKMAMKIFYLKWLIDDKRMQESPLNYFVTLLASHLHWNQDGSLECHLYALCLQGYFGICRLGTLTAYTPEYSRRFCSHFFVNILLFLERCDRKCNWCMILLLDYPTVEDVCFYCCDFLLSS